MNMPLLTYALGLGLSLAPGSSTQAVDGKALFVENKCDLCHSVATAEIPSKTPDGSKTKAVDLSGLSTKRESEWLRAYLEKKEELDGRQHPPRFRGEQRELEALVKWLMAQKPAK